MFRTSFLSYRIDDALIEKLNSSSFALIDETAEKPMRDAVEDARMAQDSIGGTIECCVTGIDAGYGEPMFEGVEALLPRRFSVFPQLRALSSAKALSFQQ